MALNLSELVQKVLDEAFPLYQNKTTKLTSIISALKTAFLDSATLQGQTNPSSTTTQEKLLNRWNQLQTYIDSRSSLENTSILLATVTFVVLLMSWSSRFGQWGGRFSPFGRSPESSGVSGAPQVSESDYSYITSDDLKRSQEESGPPRDTDLLTLKSKRVNYPVHFPAHSIGRDELTVGNVREQAAKKTGSDVRRIKLLYRGKNLKDDNKTCLSEGLRHGAEIMCAIADSMPDSQDSSGSEDEDFPVEGGSADGDTPKRRRNRNKNKKKRNKKPSGTSTPSESLPVPPADTSRAPSPKPVLPTTPLEKLDALDSKLKSLLPQCIHFTTNPPTDPAKKDFEHKRLSETILAQVLIKTDAVEVEGDPEARARRKALVKDAQQMLNGLDDAAK